jgi:hypothetical protein
MAVIINASTSTGLVQSADTSGIIQLQSNGTTAVTIDTSQNVGIGNTSPASFASTRNLALGTGSSSAALTVYTGTAQTGAVYFADGTTSADRYRGAIEYLHSSNVLAFTTDASERMRIDSNGYVTMPNQPAFHAYRTTGGVGGTGIYICNTVVFNDGSHYNSSTGRFTAPVAGRYQLNFFVLAQSSNNLDINIRVNGTLHAGFDFRCNNNAVNHNFTLSVSGILKLSANDIVDPFIASQPSGSLYGSGLNGFSMYFLG